MSHFRTTYSYIHSIDRTKSLKRQKFPFVIHFDFFFVFVLIIFAIFKDRVFISWFIDLENVYMLNYKLYLDCPLCPTVYIVCPEVKIDSFRF